MTTSKTVTNAFGWSNNVTIPKTCKCGSQMWTCSRCKLNYCPNGGCVNDRCGCPVKRQFTTTETRDRWLSQNYPNRKCGSVPGFYRVKGAMRYVYVFGLTVTEYPKRFEEEENAATK